MVEIRPGDLSDQRIIDLLHIHLSAARAASPPHSTHALDLSGLKSPDIRFWAAWEGDALLGIGALKAIASNHGEVKSMHVAQAARGRGIGGAMVRHIVAAAMDIGYTRLSLETGSMAAFAAARALYRRHGFIECPPFGSYRRDPNSVFMTMALPGIAT